ncbi:acyl carrier protein [Chryseobacterium sp. c4a]|uniref:acyl carrier protein n=1 Tax=Chryseobacterium sp. c4a TaxID=1573582 RepID=UPI001356DD87|nr:acyl carrier protein [Chryseobacterium sp. c4a]
MNQEEIFHLITKHIIEVIPELEDHNFSYEESLTDLGANSMDRVEIVIMIKETLSIDIPQTQLIKVKNIGELAQLFYENYQAS